LQLPGPSTRSWPWLTLIFPHSSVSLFLHPSQVFPSCASEGHERHRTACHERRRSAFSGRVRSSFTRRTLTGSWKKTHASAGDAGAKRKALDELVSRAQFAQAALDANLDRDPVVRAEIARVLASRLKEQTLLPRFKEMSAPIPEPRLHELYQAGIARFRSMKNVRSPCFGSIPTAIPREENSMRKN
jgi:hypothetical protein